LVDLLKNPENLNIIARSPVVQQINQKWGLQVQPGKVYDPNPDRYQMYAKDFIGETAKPSVMVNGEIIYGNGRFIAALLRGDQYLMVWNFKK
jgi:hypothetical protein